MTTCRKHPIVTVAAANLAVTVLILLVVVAVLAEVSCGAG